MDILVKADNPKGLNYEHLASSPEDAKVVIRQILKQGGKNITLNGRAMPKEVEDFIRSATH